MPFDKSCVVIGLWDGLEAKRQQVSGKAEARRVAHDWMLHGYAVAFSSALILAMGRP